MKPPRLALNLWHWFRNRLLEIAIVMTLTIIPIRYILNNDIHAQGDIISWQLSILMVFAGTIYLFVINLYALSTLIIQIFDRFALRRNDRRFMTVVYLIHTLPFIGLALRDYFVVNDGTFDPNQQLLTLAIFIVAGFISVRLTQRIVGSRTST